MPSLTETTQEIKNAIVNIKIIGIGGGGNNVVKRIANTTDLNLDLIAINTDAKQLRGLPDENVKKIQIGKNITKGLGCGGNIELGKQAAKEDYEAIKQSLKGADMIFLTAGLGSGTGTGAMPVITQIAHEMNILSVCVVTVPFTFEGSRKQRIAEQAIKDLTPYVDGLIVVHNDNLLKIKTNVRLTLVNAFRMADSVLRQAIRCISELILTVGVINVDFADVQSIFKQSTHPDAILGIGESDLGAVEAVKEAINSPLVERKLSGARGIILNVSGSEYLTLYEVNEATKYVYEQTHPDVNIILGTVINEKLGDKVRITIIATDFADDEEEMPIPKKEEAKPVQKAKAQQPEPKKKEKDALDLPDFMNKDKDKKNTNPIFSFFNFDN